MPRGVGTGNNRKCHWGIAVGTGDRQSREHDNPVGYNQLNGNDSLSLNPKGRASWGTMLWLLAGGVSAVGLLILPLVLRGILAALAVVVLLARAPRRDKFVVLAALVVAVILSLTSQWFVAVAYFFAYFGVRLFICALLVFTAFRLFGRNLGQRILTLPLTMIVIGIGGTLLAGLSSKPVPPVPEQVMGTSDEIKYLFETDQSDRLNALWVLNPERDTIRLQRVKALYRAGLVTAPIDEYRAGMIYQHATCSDDYQTAHELAKAAADHGVAEARWLSHATYDRWQMSLGKPQTYGTQFPPVPMKRPCAPDK